MTVSYNLSISTSRPWTFLRLFFRWKGSVWKVIWMQYLVWLALYALFSIMYRFLLNPWQQRIFVSFVDFTNSRLSYIPLDWMLGFFVAGVLTRFWYLYNIIGFMDNIALMTALYVRGTSEKARQIRRNIVRYSQLTQVLVFRDLSMRCRKRLPTLDAVAAAGFMMPHEKENFDDIQYNYNKYFLPFNWAWALIYRARLEGFIESDYYVTILSEEVRKFRTDLAWLCNYDWVPLPMIYPTIVCLAVHMYFLVCVVARQYVDGSMYEKDSIDMVFPFMTSIQFVLYMGWLKIAEALLNPWGLDDDNFETNMLIDRNLAMGLKIVDEGYGKTPEMMKDEFWDDEWVPLYSEESAHEKRYRTREGSLAHIKVPHSISQVRMVPLFGSTSNFNTRKTQSTKERIVQVKETGISLPDGATIMMMGSALAVPVAPKADSYSVTDKELRERRKDIPLPCGLKNLGNTCYMNSVIQSLKTVSELNEALSDCEIPQENINGKITASIKALFKTLNDPARTDAAIPLSTLSQLHTAMPHFALRNGHGQLEQQDANECFTELQRMILAAISSRPGSTGTLEKHFVGQFDVTQECEDSKDEPVQKSVENFHQLSCFLSQDVKYIQTGIKEKLSEEIHKNSEKLGRDAKWKKKALIKRLPAYISIQMVRFFYKEAAKTSAKILKYVKFPLILDLCDICTPALQEKMRPHRDAVKVEENAKTEKARQKKLQDKGTQDDDDSEDEGVKLPFSFEDDVGSNNSGYYELQAVITHKGRASNSGHYVAWVRLGGDKWAMCDDDDVLPVSGEQVLKLSGGGDWHTAYVLLYGPRIVHKFEEHKEDEKKAAVAGEAMETN